MIASRCSVVALITVVIVPCVASAQKKRQKDGKDDVVGTVWAFKAVRGADSITGVFRVHNHEVFKGPTKVGTVEPKDEDESTLVISGFPKLNGTSVIRKVKRAPAVWQGVVSRADGDWTITITIRDK